MKAENLLQEFINFKENGNEDNIFCNSTEDKEFIEIVTCLLLNRDWTTPNPISHQQILTEQLSELLPKISKFDLKAKIKNSLSNDLKNLYYALLSYHLKLWWSVEFVSKHKMLLDVILKALEAGFDKENSIVIRDKESEEVLIFYTVEGRKVYILDSNKVTGSHIKEFVDEFREKNLGKERDENEGIFGK